MTSGTTSKSRETPPPIVIADRYTVEKVLGRGGMATVYLCLDSRTGTKVAVKVLREELGSAVVVERFLREIEFASELDHPRIPKVLDSGVTGGLPFYVMTYVEGESLRERLDRVRQLPVDEAVRIAMAAMEPMTYAHRAGLVHRDIKPGNILVGDDSVYVLDFGIARAIIASADERLTSTGVAVGTPAYMSPEQALADGHLDARSDIYSLGCVIYEMIAGLPPFVGATPQAIMARRFGSPPSPLSETREGVPPHVERAVAKALCRAPADRWQSADEFGRALSSPVLSESVEDVRTQVDARRKTWGRVIAGTVGLAVVGASLWAVTTLGADPVARAHADIERWDFAAAERRLRDAVADNAGTPAAELWLAQLLVVRQALPSEWTPHALRALDAKGDLSETDSALAEAFAASDSHTHPDCGRWRPSATQTGDKARNILSTLAWADCLVRDDILVPDAAGPFGYRFRASHHSAALMYEGLLARNAGNQRAYAVIMPRLVDALPTIKNSVRSGTLGNDESAVFVAFPSLVSDTLAYVPAPLGRGSAPIRALDPVGLDRLIVRNLDRLRERAARWTAVSPDDPDAHETLGLILESRGELLGEPGSAIDHIARARRLAGANDDVTATQFMRRLRLALTGVRLQIKNRRFPEAGVLADSVLAWPRPSLDDSAANDADQMLLGLAALTGRVGRVQSISAKYAADFRVRLSSGHVRALPPEVGLDAFRLAGFALMGGPADSITGLAAGISSRLEGLVPPSQLADIRAAILRRPLSLATPDIGPAALAALGETSDPFGSAVRALAAGNRARARAFADSLASLHGDLAPGEITMDAILQQGWLLAAIGDTTGAKRLIDNALGGLSKMPSNTLTQESISAALVRVMILRAEIARNEGDQTAARTWANAVVALWGRGDPEPRSRARKLVMK